MKYGCVLMAAGIAARFGENKLLYKLDGRSLLDRALAASPACLFDRAVAVVSDDAVAARASAAGYAVMRNPDPARGQGSSITLGAAAMEGMDAVLFCVADQPYLRKESVQRLLDAWRNGAICALAFGGKRGNPVLFPSECLPELCALSPDQTGRAVLSRHADRLVLIEASSPRELHDIDTRADLPG